MVFIDGPQIPEAKSDPRYLDGNVLDVLDWNGNAFTAFLDGRLTTRDNLKLLMPQADIRFEPRHKFTRIEIPARDARQRGDAVVAGKMAPA